MSLKIRKPQKLVLALVLMLFTAANAQEVTEKQAFVEANILSIFYHELGHAVVDIHNVPIFGQEEDAADVMSVLLIDRLFEEEDAQSIAYDSAFGFINDPEQTEEVAYWDLHGPDEQRYFNHVCLFYGANPSERQRLASDLGLPDERAETCPEEYEQAADSWGMVFDELESGDGGPTLNYSINAQYENGIISKVLKPEIENLNTELFFAQQVIVRVESCGEANAFYDPEGVTVTFCTEFVPHLEDLFDRLSKS